MKNNKPVIGFFAGIAVLVLVLCLPLKGLETNGRICLALTLMTVVWWAMQVAQSGYVGGFYLVSVCLLKLAEPAVVFSGWTKSTLWLVIGAYMIASAVRGSGLGERISYYYILRFVRSWKSIIIGVFVLTFILSLLIPHPWPRAFLIMSVMSVVIRASKMPKEDAVKIGFSVFAASVPVSLIFLTGDSVINPLAAKYCGEGVINFANWMLYMGPPALVYSIMTLVLFLILFKPTKEVHINFDEVKTEQNALGSMSVKEKRTAFWIAVAIILWLTSGSTGLDVGWITLAIAMVMSLPMVGEVLTVKEWGTVPVHVLVFLTSAMAIGGVGEATGMNKWLAETVLPASLPQNIILFALFIAVISIIIHMLMGSVIAVMGIIIPTILLSTEAMGYSNLLVVFIIYLVISGHYILPFHHLNILVGQGEENGMYSQKETIKMGIPLLIPTFLIVIIATFWFKIIGLA